MTIPPSNDRPSGRGGVDVLMGVLFLCAGIVFLVIPHSPKREGMLLLLGVVNVGVGVIKIIRGIVSWDSVNDRRNPD